MTMVIERRKKRRLLPALAVAHHPRHKRLLTQAVAANEPPKKAACGQQDRAERLKALGIRAEDDARLRDLRKKGWTIRGLAAQFRLPEGNVRMVLGEPAE